MPPPTRSILQPPRKPKPPQTNTLFPFCPSPAHHAIPPHDHTPTAAADDDDHDHHVGSEGAMSILDPLATLGLGYAIAIALGFLVLLASLLLASYFCLRRGGPAGFGMDPAGVGSARHAASSASSSGHISIIVPRVVFVAEDYQSPGSSSRGAAAAASPVGLDPSVIASYPRVPFSKAAAGAGADAEVVCSICLCEYREGEMLRVMPECRHRFHLTCLDAWLRRSASCPVCRSSPIPTPVATPLSTPLSELVPLSQYAADRRRNR